MTGPQGDAPPSHDSLLSRILKERAERERRAAEDERHAATERAEREERARRLGALRDEWQNGWSNLLEHFDRANQYALRDFEDAGAALAAVGALMNRLSDEWLSLDTEQEFPARPSVALRLQRMVDYPDWFFGGLRTCGALLLEAAQGGTPAYLAEQLRQLSGSEALRPAFGWLEFCRDRLFPPQCPPLRGVGWMTEQAEPAVRWHVRDYEVAEAILGGGADPRKVNRKSGPPRQPPCLPDDRPEPANAPADQPDPQATAEPTNGERADDATDSPTWNELGEAKKTILTVLARAADPMQNPAVAQKAGYKPGTLRHHYGGLKDWRFVELTKDGYRITPAGRALIPPDKV
ncbi:hypothetical protein [Frigoriglobus tundricola]|uniref:Uncharacterized protein n=1 Tax=Frigoriglobus tundricola TaxID=2774151 RepID=A0A6M5Z1G0_9BACT|nr:hypothetical protein [Frigoriglobus tundricola]QJX00248.1 hypothetical protein FTUN_7872 [Frigoriglobus tundricola]